MSIPLMRRKSVISHRSPARNSRTNVNRDGRYKSEIATTHVRANGSTERECDDTREGMRHARTPPRLRKTPAVIAGGGKNGVMEGVREPRARTQAPRRGEEE